MQCRASRDSFDCNKFKKVADIPCFWACCSHTSAWLRSGGSHYDSIVNLLKTSGGYYDGDTDLRYAVRPASLDCNKFKKDADIPCFWACCSHTSAWLRSGHYYVANYACFLYSNGSGDFNGVDRYYAVRPASLDSNKFKKAAYISCFWVCCSYINAWSRSGNSGSVVDVYIFSASGGVNLGDEYRYYAVRPASLDCDKFKKAADISRFWVCCSYINAWSRSSGNLADYVYAFIASGGIYNGPTAYRLAVRPALHLFAEKIYCRQFPNSVRISTAEQLSYEMKGAIVPLAP